MFFSLCDVGSSDERWIGGSCLTLGMLQMACRIKSVLFIYVAISASEPQFFSCGRVSASD